VTFAELKAELAARGFDYLDDDRQGLMVNRSRADLDDMYRWPYREAAVTGTVPMIISDLGDVQAVIDLTTMESLQHADYATLLNWYGDLSITGCPAYWYRGTPGGIPEVSTVPVAMGSVGVQYWRVTPDLVDPEDTPEAPSRFHGLIVDIAVRRAYQDSDNHAAAAALATSISLDLNVMVASLLTQDQVTHQQILGASIDW
jgi:hypothetical protein